MDLTSSYLGIKIDNPIVIGSSGLSASIQGIKALAENGAGAIVLKSIFEEEIVSQYNEVFKEGLAFQESNLEFLDYYDYEIKKEVLVKHKTLIQQAKQEVDVPIVASINCLTSTEWMQYAQKLEEAGADAIELNIFKLPFSCEKEGGCIDDEYVDIAKKIKETVSIPVGFKLAPYFSNLRSVANNIMGAGVDGLILFNRFVDIDFDIEKENVTNVKMFSSDNEYHNALRWISLLYSNVNGDLIASTGVHNWETVVKMILAGASSVEMVSSIYKYGPDHVKDVLRSLEAWMEKKGHDSLDAFRGKMARSSSENPEQYERVQFMKYFADYRKNI